MLAGFKRAKILSYSAKSRTAKVHIHGMTDGASDGRHDLKTAFAQHGIEVKPLSSGFEEIAPVNGIYNGVGYASFYNPTGSHADIEIIITDASPIDQYIVDPVYGENKTVVLDPPSKKAAFCLD